MMLLENELDAYVADPSAFGAVIADRLDQYGKCSYTVDPNGTWRLIRLAVEGNSTSARSPNFPCSSACHCGASWGEHSTTNRWASPLATSSAAIRPASTVLPTPTPSAMSSRVVSWARRLLDLEPPFIIDRDPEPLSAWPRRGSTPVTEASPGDVLHGMGGSAGQYEGTAWVVADLRGAMALEPGEILVAPVTDAAGTPLFLVAGAVVVNVGALNSHAVVVSRELGLPCVLSLGDATSRIANGERLAVDGPAGTVTVLAD